MDSLGTLWNGRKRTPHPPITADCPLLCEIAPDHRTPTEQRIKLPILRYSPINHEGQRYGNFRPHVGHSLA